MMGHAYAEELILAMGHLNNPAMLSQVSRAVIGKGAFGAVEIGFSHRLAERLMNRN